MSETLTMYELGDHLDPALDEPAAAQQRIVIEKLATDKGATIVISKEPERTRLSYPINHQRASYFGYFRFTLENKDGLAEMDEEQFVKEVAACGIGKNYLCDRKKIEDEYQARRDKLTGADESESFREKKR